VSGGQAMTDESKDLMIKRLRDEVTSLRAKKKRANTKYYVPVGDRSGFQIIAKNIATQKLFALNKFVTSQKQLDDCDTPGTLGSVFLILYQKRINTTTPDETFDSEKKKQIWAQAKGIVHQAINLARSTMQLALYKRWKGT